MCTPWIKMIKFIFGTLRKTFQSCQLFRGGSGPFCETLGVKRRCLATGMAWSGWLGPCHVEAPLCQHWSCCQWAQAVLAGIFRPARHFPLCQLRWRPSGWQAQERIWQGSPQQVTGASCFCRVLFLFFFLGGGIRRGILCDLSMRLIS